MIVNNIYKILDIPGIWYELHYDPIIREYDYNGQIYCVNKNGIAIDVNCPTITYNLSQLIYMDNENHNERNTWINEYKIKTR